MHNLPKNHSADIPNARDPMQLQRLHRLQAGPEYKCLIGRGGARHFHLGGHWRSQLCNKGSCKWSVQDFQKET